MALPPVASRKPAFGTASGDYADGNQETQKVGAFDIARLSEAIDLARGSGRGLRAAQRQPIDLVAVTQDTFGQGQPTDQAERETCAARW